MLASPLHVVQVYQLGYTKIIAVGSTRHDGIDVAVYTAHIYSGRITID
jgi:hypothetical protein